MESKGICGQDSNGISKILSVDLTNRKPLNSQTLEVNYSGGTLDFAFHEYHGLPYGDSELSYGDGGRFITYEVLS